MPAPPPSPIPRRPLRTPEPLLMIPLADTSLHNATHSETSAPTRASIQCLPPSEAAQKDVKRRAFSFARDTKASIARAARSRYPSAPLRQTNRVDQAGASKGGSLTAGQGAAAAAASRVKVGGRAVTPAASRAGTPIPIKLATTGMSRDQRATGSRPATPAAVPSPPTKPRAGTPWARAGGGGRSPGIACGPALATTSSRTSPSAFHPIPPLSSSRGATPAPSTPHTPLSSTPRTPMSRRAATSRSSTPALLQTPTPRARPLTSRTDTPYGSTTTPTKVSPTTAGIESRSGREASLYGRLSSLTSSTRGTVGRAGNDTQAMPSEKGGGRDKNCEDRPKGQAGAGAAQTAAGAGPLASTAVHTIAEAVRACDIQASDGRRTSATSSATPKRTTTSIPASPPKSPSITSRGTRWLKRMGSSGFSRAAGRVAAAGAACTTPPSMLSRRLQVGAGGGTPMKTPEKKSTTEVGAAEGDRSPWISARTLAVEDPIARNTPSPRPSANVSTTSATTGFEPSPEELKQVEHPIYICHAVKEKSSSAEVAIADLGVATKSGRAANGTIKRKLVPSLTGSHLRDIERAWRRAIEVEIMSAAEGECLAGAECVSVYDPWGDIEELLGLPWTMTKSHSGPPLLNIRPGAPDTKQNSNDEAASGMPYSTAISRKNVRPGADYVVAHFSIMPDMAQTAPFMSTCTVQRSHTTCSALSTSSVSSAPSSLSLETPRTPHRARDIARRLQGDMRDNLDYLYDTFALDTCGDDEDGDVTIREGGMDTTRTGMTGTGLEDGQYAASVSPWQLVMPSPHVSKPYEGVQMDDE